MFLRPPENYCGWQAGCAAADDAGRQVRVAASVPLMFGSYQPDKFDRMRR